jgi:energy-coupling factor transport system ATP-binding protein
MSVVFKHLNFLYSPNSPLVVSALKDINLTIKDNSFTCLIGHTGSGKSTLVQQINALLLPTSGEVEVNGLVVTNKDNQKKQIKKIKKDKKNVKDTFNIKELRKGVGLVFQFPEYQLFEETILKDVSFGPKNFEYSDEEAEKMAKEALNLVGISEDLYERNPFELSGGQRRRVAIAGIITLKPKILILDEPTAGLDPQGSQEMMELFLKLHQLGTTIIMVTHDMDNVIKYGSDVVVLSKGEIIKECKPYELFLDKEVLSSLSIEEPKVISFAKKLITNGYNIQLENVKDVASLVKEIKKESGKYE